MDVGESVDREIGGGELGLDHVEWGFWCCSSGGVGLDLVRRYSIQVRRSFKVMVWFGERCNKDNCWHVSQFDSSDVVMMVMMVIWMVMGLSCFEQGAKQGEH